MAATIEFIPYSGRTVILHTSSNQVAVPVYDSIVSLTKIADVRDALTGEVIVFTIFVRNESTRTIRQVTLSDELAEYYSFVPESVEIQGVQHSHTTPYAITLGALEPGESIKIQYRTMITYVPQRIMTSTQASLAYLSIDEQTRINSNFVYIELFPSGVDLSKQAGVVTAMVGSRFTYQITAVHDGLLTGELLLIDKLPAEVEFIPGSLFVNGQPRIGETPESGITWEYFEVGQIVIVSFDVRVISRPNTGKLFNEVISSFTVQLPSGREAVSTYSADVEQVIVTDPLVVRKSVSAAVVQAGSEVGYTIVITNLLSHELDNVTVTDLLPDGLQSVPGSILINGLPDLNGSDLVLGVRLGTLEAGSMTTITFRAQLIQYAPNMLISNQAGVRYTGENIQGSVLSNIVTIAANPAPPIPPPPIDPDKLIVHWDSTNANHVYFVGDVIQLQYILENISNNDLFNLYVQFTINKNGAFVVGSLIVDGQQLDANPFGGFVIRELKRGQRIIIRFQVRTVHSSDENELVVKANISYNYRGDDGVIGYGYVTSAPANYRLYDASIAVTKLASTKVATVGDRIDYVITVQNTGDTIVNLHIIDKLPANLKLVTGAYVLSSVEPNEHAFVDGLMLPNVEPGTTHRIRYTVVVTHTIGRHITNTALVISTAKIGTESREFYYRSNTVEIRLHEDEE